MESRKSIRNIVAGAGLAGLVFLAFGGALKCGFVRFDDHGYVYENAQVSQGLTAAGIRWAFTTAHMSNWHPLTWISHMTDVEMYGLEPAGHHLTSLVLHALNVLLLFSVLRGLTGRFYPSLLVVALWAVHPLRVESVVWISERKDVLAMFFGLLAVWAYGRLPMRGRMGWVAFAFAWSLMSKPLWVTLPFLLLLLDFWPLKRWPESSGWMLVREKWLLFVLAASSCAVTYGVQQAGGAVQSFDYYPFEMRLANAVVAYTQYIRMLFWPVHLSVFYPHPGTGQLAGRVWSSLIFLILITAWAVEGARRRPWWLVGWLWFLGSLVPMIGLVQVGGQAWADRYTYLPHIGLLVALVWGVGEVVEAVRSSLLSRNLIRCLRTGMAVSAGTVVLVLAFMSRQQTLAWRDSETLCLHSLAGQEKNATLRLILADVYLEQGRMDEVIQQYRQTVADFPRHALALNNLARLLASDIRCTPAQAEEALSLANRAIENTKTPTAAMQATLALAQWRARGISKPP